jgi:hypothetical protein
LGLKAIRAESKDGHAMRSWKEFSGLDVAAEIAEGWGRVGLDPLAMGFFDGREVGKGSIIRKRATVYRLRQSVIGKQR